MPHSESLLRREVWWCSGIRRCMI